MKMNLKAILTSWSPLHLRKRIKELEERAQHMNSPTSTELFKTAIEVLEIDCWNSPACPRSTFASFDCEACNVRKLQHIVNKLKGP